MSTLYVSYSAHFAEPIKVPTTIRSSNFISTMVNKFVPPRLFGSPLPISGECFSGWIYRLYLCHGSAILTLKIALGIGSNMDFLIDFQPNFTDKDIGLIEAITLVPGSVIRERFFTSISSPFARYLIRQLDGRPLYGVCPACLSEGTPYLRLRWRLAYNVVCEKHSSPIVRDCRNCLRSLSYSRHPKRYRKWTPAESLRRCPFCCAIITTGPRKLSKATAKKLIAWQRSAHESVVRGHYTNKQGETVSANSFLNNYFVSVPYIATKEDYRELDLRLCVESLPQEDFWALTK